MGDQLGSEMRKIATTSFDPVYETGEVEDVDTKTDEVNADMRSGEETEGEDLMNPRSEKNTVVAEVAEASRDMLLTVVEGVMLAEGMTEGTSGETCEHTDNEGEAESNVSEEGERKYEKIHKTPEELQLKKCEVKGETGKDETAEETEVVTKEKGVNGMTNSENVEQKSAVLRENLESKNYLELYEEALKKQENQRRLLQFQNDALAKKNKTLMEYKEALNKDKEALMKQESQRQLLQFQNEALAKKNKTLKEQATQIETCNQTIRLLTAEVQKKETEINEKEKVLEVASNRIRETTHILQKKEEIVHSNRIYKQKNTALLGKLARDFDKMEAELRRKDEELSSASKSLQIGQEKLKVGWKKLQQREAKLEVESKNLQEREAKLKVESKNLQETEAKLKVESKNLQKREANLKQGQAKLCEQSTLLGIRQTELDRREKELTEKLQKAQQLSKSCKGTGGRLKCAETQTSWSGEKYLKQYEEEVKKQKELKKTIACQNHALSSKNKLIAEQSEKLNEKEKQIGELTATLKNNYMDMVAVASYKQKYEKMAAEHKRVADLENLEAEYRKKDERQRNIFLSLNSREADLAKKEAQVYEAPEDLDKRRSAELRDKEHDVAKTLFVKQSSTENLPTDNDASACFVRELRRAQTELQRRSEQLTEMSTRLRLTEARLRQQDINHSAWEQRAAVVNKMWNILLRDLRRLRLLKESLNKENVSWRFRSSMKFLFGVSAIIVGAGVLQRGVFADEELSAFIQTRIVHLCQSFSNEVVSRRDLGVLVETIMDDLWNWRMPVAAVAAAGAGLLLLGLRSSAKGLLALWRGGPPAVATLHITDGELKMREGELNDVLSELIKCDLVSPSVL